MLIERLSIKQTPALVHLAQLPQPVVSLSVIGPLQTLLAKPQVAIVGARKLTTYGQTVTYKLAQDLARAGVVIVSGLALGVDSVAHKAVVDLGLPTIAVLPRGLDKIYPVSHTQLARRILETGGALVSEYPAGQGAPMKHQFIARNRIIAAISQGVVITEAAAKSGSLHTADFALEQGQDVFAVPGPITSTMSAGTNNLIKNGAHPITGADDVLEILGIQANQATYKPASAAEAAILNLLKDHELPADQLLAKSDLSASLMQQTLTMLELNDIIRRNKANNWTLT